MEARTTYDFADRPATLTAIRPGLPDQPLVTASTYLPSGPLSALTLGSGLTETRTFTSRYFPLGIALASGGTDHLRWNYSTDNEGNILTIADALNAAGTRTYGYQDIHYFLTQGNGPWGNGSWTYDKIGNRLTETRGSTTENYTYQPAPGGGRTPILSTVQTSAGTRTYTFGPAGQLEKVGLGTDATTFRNDASGRLGALESSTSGVQLLYDGRGYLTKADAEAPPFLDGFETGNVCGWTAAQGLAAIPVCTTVPVVRPTYNSEGLLHALQRNTTPDQSYVFYFGGRPVAQLDRTGSTETWKFLATDHLGTPIAATSPAGTLLWQGGFEPFGADWNGAGGAGVFLRFPGQWMDGTWGGFGDFGLHYNVFRWYDQKTARYSQPDSIGLRGGPNLFSYGHGNPLMFKDDLGLQATSGDCCERAHEAGFFLEPGGKQAGGIVVCCRGKKVACTNPGIGNPMFDVMGETLIADCIIEHEETHFNDVPCPPDCELARPNSKGKPPALPGDSQSLTVPSIVGGWAGFPVRSQLELRKRRVGDGGRAEATSSREVRSNDLCSNWQVGRPAG